MRGNVVPFTIDNLPEHMRKQILDYNRYVDGAQREAQERLWSALGDKSMRVLRRNLRDELFEIWMVCESGQLFCYTNGGIPAKAFNQRLFNEMLFSRYDRAGFLRAVDEQNAAFERHMASKRREEIQNAVERTADLVSSPRLHGKNVHYPGMDNHSKNHVQGIG